jgi:Transposase zinc-ribbon domain
MNLIDITKKFQTDAECFEFLEQQRWPDGTVRCVTCGNDKISRITRKTSTTTKNKRAQIYQCLEKTCKQQFSCTSGTLYNDTRLPILTWFMAVEMVMSAKKGMSAVQVQRHLGIKSYQTAWHMVHRIREAMDMKGASTSATLPNSLRTVLLRCVLPSRLLIAVWFQSRIYLFRRYDLACSFLVSQLRVSMFLRWHPQHVSDNSFKFLFIYWHGIPLRCD